MALKYVFPKRSWVAVLLLGAIAFIGAMDQARAEEVAVHFDRGKSGKTIRGTIRGDQYIDYIVSVGRSNQMLSVHMTASNASNYFNVLPPTGETALFVGSTSGNDYEQRLSKPGDYRVRVYLMRNAARRNESSRYTITIGATGGGSAGGGSGGSVPIEDLKGMDAVKAIDAMTSRGFAGVDTITSGSTLYHIYYLASTHQCVQMTTADNRVVDIRDIETHPKCR